MFSELVLRQSLDHRQIAFGSLFGLDLVNISMYVNVYHNISAVQELWLRTNVTTRKIVLLVEFNFCPLQHLKQILHEKV